MPKDRGAARAKSESLAHEQLPPGSRARRIFGVPGYNRGSTELARSPVPLAELELLKRSLAFTDEDVRFLKLSFDVLRDQMDEVLDAWYSFMGAQPHLARHFADAVTGQMNQAYLAAVRKRFGQWIVDTANATFDQEWLDYQHEIGLRHHRAKKNLTDGANSSEQVPFSHLMALTFPISATLKPFLAGRGHSAESVEKMHQAWSKVILLQVILWSHPYVREGDF